jgi:hypothetical protein
MLYCEQRNFRKAADAARVLVRCTRGSKSLRGCVVSQGRIGGHGKSDLGFFIRSSCAQPSYVSG